MPCNTAAGGVKHSDWPMACTCDTHTIPSLPLPPHCLLGPINDKQPQLHTAVSSSSSNHLPGEMQQTPHHFQNIFPV
jgi:hypothetical protein